MTTEAFDMTKNTRRLIAHLHDAPKVKVLFVCLGNICRSPAADGVFHAIVKEEGDESRFDIDSAGTQGYHAGDLPDRRMRQHGLRRGYDFNHVCRKVTPDDFDNFDLIVAMDNSNFDNLRHMALTDTQRDKVVKMAEFLDGVYARWDCVPDPYYEGAEGFELVLDLLENGCRNLHNLLIS